MMGTCVGGGSTWRHLYFTLFLERELKSPKKVGKCREHHFVQLCFCSQRSVTFWWRSQVFRDNGLPRRLQMITSKGLKTENVFSLHASQVRYTCIMSYSVKILSLVPEQWGAHAVCSTSQGQVRFFSMEMISFLFNVSMSSISALKQIQFRETSFPCPTGGSLWWELFYPNLTQLPCCWSWKAGVNRNIKGS